jgi:hypothetical protein
MTVEELIKKLQDLPSEAKLLPIYTIDGEYGDHTASTAQIYDSNKYEDLPLRVVIE